MTTTPCPARVAAPLKSRARSLEAREAGAADDKKPGAREASPPPTGTTDERARILQEYAARQRVLAPPVKRQRRVSKAEEATSPPSVARAGQDVEEQASTAASTPAGSVATNASIEVVAVKENVAVAVVAQEEKRLDGAPEGELFIVQVLSREEFQPSASLDDETRELDALLALLEAANGDSASSGDDGELSWGKQYAAVDTVRRLALHHRREAQARLGRALSLLVLPSVSSLRSAMTRNALLCIQDIVSALPADTAAHFGTIVPLLVLRACNEKQFIRDAATDVLDTTLKKAPNESLLSSLLLVSADKNPQAVSIAGVYATKVITAMDSEQLKTFASETHPAFLEELSVFLSCKVVECKVHTRKSLQFARKAIGDAKFVAMAKARLAGSARLDVLKASEPRKKAADPKGRPSIRERMMQMKKAKEAAAGGNQSTDTASGVVVASLAPTNSSATASDSSMHQSPSL